MDFNFIAPFYGDILFVLVCSLILTFVLKMREAMSIVMTLGISLIGTGFVYIVLKIMKVI